MTITPDQARELLDGATTGPWRALHDRWEDEYGIPCEDFYVLGGPDGILHTEDFDPDTHNPAANTTLAAAAPDLAQTIAGLRWEYAVEDLNGDILDLNDDAYTSVETLWTWHREVAEETHAAEYGSTLVRRLAGPIEPIDKETPND